MILAATAQDASGKEFDIFFCRTDGTFFGHLFSDDEHRRGDEKEVHGSPKK